MNVVSRGVRDAFRSLTRTISIVLVLGLAIGLAFVMASAHHSVNNKIASTLRSIGNTVTIGPPGYSTGMLLGKNLTSSELAPILRLPGVKSLDETLNGSAKTFGTSVGGCPSSGKCSSSSRLSSRTLGSTSLKSPESLAARRVGLECEPKPCTPPVVGSQPIYFSGSTQPSNASNIGASTLRIVKGHSVAGTGTSSDAMVSTEMAKKNGLSIGSTFSAFGIQLLVKGIFKTDNQSADNTVVTSLGELQHLAGNMGQVETAVVTVRSLTQLASTTSAIESMLGPQASVVSNVGDADKAVNSLDTVESISLYSLSGAVGAAVVILFLVMVIIVRERKREIGILKAIGFSNRRIVAQYSSTAVTFTVFGWLIGLIIGLIGVGPITSSLVSNSGVSTDTGARGLFGASNPLLAHLSDVNAQVGWAAIFEVLAVAIVIAIVASAFSAWLISKVRPAEVLRSE